MSRSPAVSVIVPHYRDLAGLDRCLAALARQTYPAADFEVIVSDNASPEGEAAVAEVIAGRARLIITQCKGAGPARNGGVAVSRAQILAFTDSDCRPDAAWLEQGVAALAHHDFVGGRMNVLVDDLDAMTAAEAFERVFAFDNADYVRRKGFTVTANLFCPRAIFDAVGAFRVGVSEDVDWSARARALGYRIGYAERAIIGHPARRTWAELTTKWRRMNAEQFNLARLQRGGRVRWAARSALLPVSVLAHAPKVFTSRELATLPQRVGALGVLVRLRHWRFVDAMRLAAQSKPY
jgi:glycosyltransferase involved in cell wall biosynthesis